MRHPQFLWAMPNPHSELGAAAWVGLWSVLQQRWVCTARKRSPPGSSGCFGHVGFYILFSAKASLGCPFADSTNNCDLSLQYSHARSVASLSSLKVATKLRNCDEPRL